MADCNSIPSPRDRHTETKPTSFPGSFTGTFTFNTPTETTETTIMSPTSILDSKPFSALKNPFPKSPEPKCRRHWDKSDPKRIGLGIVDSLKDESTMILFGSKLKVQIPPPLLPPLFSPAESPKSPPDFGIKTRNPQLGSFSPGISPFPVKKTAFGSGNNGVDGPNSPGVFNGCLSASEMELSEDYTCVIFHGPNPKTTHIFDNCIIESDGVDDSDSREVIHDNGFLSDGFSYASEDFLSFCCTCKKNLDLGKDIYMYRGEKAFCSRECRHQEMVMEEGFDNLEVDDVYGAF